MAGWGVRASPYAGPIGFFPRHEYFPPGQGATVCGWHDGTGCGGSHVPHLCGKCPHQAGNAHHDIIGALRLSHSNKPQSSTLAAAPTNAASVGGEVELS